MPSRKRRAGLQASIAKRWAGDVERVDDDDDEQSSPSEATRLAVSVINASGWQCAVGAGFEGRDNRCFLNAVLQALSHLPALAALLLAPGVLHGAYGCPSAGACLVCLLGDTMRRQRRGARGTSVSAAALQLRLHELDALPRLERGMQQDA